jgi:hypothetical protein
LLYSQGVQFDNGIHKDVDLILKCLHF